MRIATLLLLAESPMHGYQIMQAMADRTDGAWRPSPGAVYPTLAQLEDEGLVTTEVEGGRKLVTLTAQGRDHVEEHRAGWGDPFGQATGQKPGPDLRGPLHELHVAARSVAVTGSAAQVEAAAAVLTEARRSLYLILAGEPGSGEGG
nr:PadR family transcriptional regulator [uncultured Friedmanniella sp.]